MIAKPKLTRRTILGLLATAALPISMAEAADPATAITVWKDPNCGCCGRWVAHLGRNGFAVTVTDTGNVQDIKVRLGVPPELASCHTAEVSGYVIEGHVPAIAILRLLAEKPGAVGLAVPGMPIGSPGMEGGMPEVYDVILFSGDKRQSFGRFRQDRPA